MRRRLDDRGVVTAWFAVFLVACALAFALVVDGGKVLRARADAFSLAGSAARAGAQQVDESSVLEGGLRLDQQRSRDVALSFLAARGSRGDVTVTDTTVTVTAITQAQLRLLTIGGAKTVDVSATATADIRRSP